MTVTNELRAGGSRKNLNIVQKFVLYFIGQSGPKPPPRQLQCPNPNPQVVPAFAGSNYDGDPCQE